MDYAKIASQVIEHVGGKQNIKSVQHCATRLRLQLKDNDLRNEEAVSDIEGVKGVFLTQSQFQIIFGSGLVNLVCDEVQKQLGISVDTPADAEKEEKKGNVLQRLVKLLSDIFVPIIPAIVATGLLMGLLEGFSTLFPAMANSDTYKIFHMFSNTAFTFLPILIATSAAKAFGGNMFLGSVIGMIMIHPDLMNAWSVASAVEAGEAIPKFSVWFGLYDVNAVGYQGHVIPVIISVWLMCFLEKRLHKIVPASIDLFVTPLVSVGVSGYLALTAIGPVFSQLETWVLDGVQWLIAVPYGIGAFLMGGLYSSTVVAGVHHMYTIIDLGQLSQYGVTHWLPLASAANMAQGAACLAVGLKSRGNQKMRSLAFPAALSCMKGITEPAIFGVNLRHIKVFICGSIGGACGALMTSIFHLGATATGVTGIFAILLHLNQPVQYIVSMLVAMGVAFLLTWIFGHKAEKPAAAKTASNA